LGVANIPKEEIPTRIINLKKQMDVTTGKLGFEAAIIIRNKIKKLQDRIKK